MTTTVRRAGAFALVGTLALAVPPIAGLSDRAVATVAAPGPFLVVAALALYVVDEGPVFELFARPGDRRDGRLYGLAGFALAAAALALLSVRFSMPVPVFVGTVLLLSWGNLGGHLVRSVRDEPVVATAGFVVAGFFAGSAGQYAAAQLVGRTVEWPLAAFLAASGALLGALLRAVLFERDDPLVMVSIGLLLWLFADLPLEVHTTGVAVALAVTVVLGYLAYALETASLPGLITGVFLALQTIVLGDVGWFLLLVTFFGVGGLSTKFRYEEKERRGIAEENDGARGSGNVLANSLVGLFAVLGWSASPTLTGVHPDLFLFAFAGSIAAAMSDTLSSEIGGVFDDPRLITTLESVEPGTDGAVTWQGEVAGLAGAALIAAIALGAFGRIGGLGAGIVVFGGVVGMTVDSLLGATVEDVFLENEGVNFFATLAAGIAAGLAAVGVGLVAL
ncbi:MAG: TIGR00297 family protein [Halosimplex sp.]